jgi:hypothetical protein
MRNIYKIDQHIYITSGEDCCKDDFVIVPCSIGKVKELHWKYGNDNPSYIVEDILITSLRYGQKENELELNSFRSEHCKKIILTTNKDIDGVQPIDDDFIEWYIKNPNCKEVETYQFGFDDDIIKHAKKWYIEIPKEETYSKEDMILAAKYGYDFHKTTQFPKQDFEASCIRNTEQWLTTFKNK